MTTVLTLPPGKYYIGDPYWIFNDQTLQALLVAAKHFQEGDIVEFNGFELWAAKTAWGSGTFEDQNGAEYAVDSSYLGAVPLELVEVPEGLEHGTSMEFSIGLNVKEHKGTFWFGIIVIKTDDDEESDPYAGDESDDEFI